MSDENPSRNGSGDVPNQKFLPVHKSCRSTPARRPASAEKPQEAPADLQLPHLQKVAHDEPMAIYASERGGEMSDRPTPETDAEDEKLDFKVDLNFARKLERERDDAQQIAKELTELVDGAYVLVELDKPDGAYNKKWQKKWLEKAKRLIPGVDSLWY